MYIDTKVVVFYSSLGRHKWSLFEIEDEIIIFISPEACGCRHKVDTVGKVITFDMYYKTDKSTKELSCEWDMPEDLVLILFDKWVSLR